MSKHFDFAVGFLTGYGDLRGYGYGYGDDLPSPQTHGNSMGIFNQPEITH